MKVSTARLTFMDVAISRTGLGCGVGGRFCLSDRRFCADKFLDRSCAHYGTDLCRSFGWCSFGQQTWGVEPAQLPGYRGHWDSTLVCLGWSYRHCPFDWTYGRLLDRLCGSCFCRRLACRKRLGSAGMDSSSSYARRRNRSVCVWTILADALCSRGHGASGWALSLYNRRFDKDGCSRLNFAFGMATAPTV
jgi:hypothetical protein